MLDWETLGTGPHSAVVSLGAVAFNRNGIISKRKFVFDTKSQLRAGRTVDGGTIAWWMKQSDRARSVFNEEGAIEIGNFFGRFEAFCDMALNEVGELRDQLKIWGNGANFDVSILEDLYRCHHAMGPEGIPWRYWNVWCFRTFDHLHKVKKLHRRPQGSHHDALDDAVYQVNCLLAYWAKTKRGSNEANTTKGRGTGGT